VAGILLEMWLRDKMYVRYATQRTIDETSQLNSPTIHADDTKEIRLSNYGIPEEQVNKESIDDGEVSQ